MALRFVPHPGTVLLCDYDLGRSASIAGEITKRRLVVVVSPHRRRHLGPYVIVPLSTQSPRFSDATHHRILAGSYDFLTRDADSWAKCELVSAVGSQRLSRLRRHGVYLTPRIGIQDLRLIRLGVIHALGARSLLDRS